MNGSHHKITQTDFITLQPPQQPIFTTSQFVSNPYCEANRSFKNTVPQQIIRNTTNSNEDCQVLQQKNSTNPVKTNGNCPEYTINTSNVIHQWKNDLENSHLMPFPDRVRSYNEKSKLTESFYYDPIFEPPSMQRKCSYNNQDQGDNSMGNTSVDFDWSQSEIKDKLHCQELIPSKKIQELSTLSTSGSIKLLDNVNNCHSPIQGKGHPSQLRKLNKKYKQYSSLVDIPQQQCDLISTSRSEKKPGIIIPNFVTKSNSKNITISA